MHHEVNKPALSRYFTGLAEQTFQSQLGVVDTKLIDYISDLLIRFIHHDDVFQIRDLAGRRVEIIGEMLREAEARVGQARRHVHQHIGDFTLFWSGVYPEALRAMTKSGSKAANNYATLGKRAYYVASTIETAAEETAPAEVLERLSLQFEMCAYGLREVRRSRT